MNKAQFDKALAKLLKEAKALPKPKKKPVIKYRTISVKQHSRKIRVKP